MKSQRIAAGTIYAQAAWLRDQFNFNLTTLRSLLMGDLAYIVGVIVFFILCAIYVAALERI
jgi:hypothetical protein